jgi:hypothetical protein
MRLGFVSRRACELFTPADTAHMAIAKTRMGVDRPIGTVG